MMFLLYFHRELKELVKEVLRELKIHLPKENCIFNNFYKCMKKKFIEPKILITKLLLFEHYKDKFLMDNFIPYKGNYTLEVRTTNTKYLLNGTKLFVRLTYIIK